MQLTKYSHSCVRFDDGNRSVVIDPGMFSDLDAALDGVDAVLITHEHGDHLDADRLRAAARRDSRLRIWAPASVGGTLGDLGDQITVVGVGEAFQAAGFEVRTFGGQHALIHPLIPVVANIGYLVNGSVYHPGDSLVVPSVPVGTLLLPSVAPWSKLSEVIDFAVSTRAPKVYPIHDFIVTDAYHGILRNNLAPIVGSFGIEFLPFDESVDA